jgi:hypothetical protein
MSVDSLGMEYFSCPIAWFIYSQAVGRELTGGMWR